MFKLDRQAALLGLPLFFASQLLLAQAPPVDVGSVSSPDYRQGGGGRGNLSEMFYQMQLLQQEVMELRGIVEQQSHDLEELKKQNLERYIDLDKRLSSAPPAASTPDSSSDLSSEEVVVSSPRTKSLPKAEEAPEKPKKKKQSASRTETQEYRDAFDLVKAKRFDSALEAFGNFLEKHPDSNLTPNAYYWKGELHLVSDPMDLVASRAAFSKLIAKYPNHQKVPDTMFKLGKVYFLQDEKAKAKHLFNQVIERYGDGPSGAPKLAKKFLKDNF